MAGRVTYHGGLVTDGLILHLDAARKPSYPGSGDVWYDLTSKRSVATTYNGATYLDDSFSFDGANDYIRLASNFLAGLELDGITLAAWIRPETLSGLTLIAGAWAMSVSNDQAALFTNNTSLLMAVADGSVGESGANSSSVLTTNQWQYVVGTWDISRTHNFYYNGNFVNSGTQGGAGWNANTSAKFEIGGQHQNSRRYFDGEIAQVNVYNRALSASEVLQNYNALKGRFGL